MKGDFSRLTDDPEKQYSGVLMQQGRVLLDADWNEQQAITRRRIETEARDLIGPCGAPKDNAGFQIFVTTVDDIPRLFISKGRYYVDGVLCENKEVSSYDQQPYLINPPDPKTLLTADKPVGIVYLEAWQRHITALDDPHIRESALGGPDTAGRTQTVWQVKILPVKPVSETVSCDSQFDDWDKLIMPTTGNLNARTQPLSADDTPCVIAPSAGYQRLENQLYRVEIHHGGALSGTPGASAAPTFVWSRDNGAVVTAIKAINSQVIKVHDLGPDSVLGFASGQLVEITDDKIELDGRPGQLFIILEVNAATNEIKLDAVPTGIDLERHPKLRRWDSEDEITVDRPIANDGWLRLEGGIEVQFSDGEYHTGDYWLIPARTAIGRIEWPPFESPDAAPIPQPPLGIQRHYCRLALIQFESQDLNVIANCRRIFCPLPSCREPSIRIEDIRVGSDQIKMLLNDTAITIDDLIGGLLVSCTSDDTFEIDPATIKRSTCYITVESPFFATTTNQTASLIADPVTASPLIGFHPLILASDLMVIAAQIQLKPSSRAAAWLRGLTTVFAKLPDHRILARLTLKGNFIWAKHDPNLYLDGDSFGVPGDGHIDVLLNSGDGRRGGDFEMWFWLVDQEPIIIIINPATLPNGTVNVPYQQMLTATGGTGPYGFTVTAGALPPGLSLEDDGLISGTTASPDTFNFTVKAVDSNDVTGARSYTLLIAEPSPSNPQLQITKIAFDISGPPRSGLLVITPEPPAQNFPKKIPLAMNATQRITAIEVTFNRPIKSTGLGSGNLPQSMFVEDITNPLRLHKLAPGDIVIKAKPNETQPSIARYTFRAPLTGGKYLLTLWGDASFPMHPAVEALDGKRLDGNYDNQEGGNFVLEIETT